VVMGTGYNPRIVTDGLVLCLDAANSRSYPKSGTTWSDLVGGNDATMTNMDATNFSSDNGGILNFDGADDYLTTASNIGIIGSSDRSLCVWFYHNSTADAINITGYGVNGQKAIFDIIARYTDGYHTVIGHFYGTDNNTISTLPSRNTINYLGWNYVCLTYSYNNVSVYTNGEFSNSKALLINTTDSTLKIGKATYSQVDGYSGKIAGVQLYNKTLTADEVRRNYLATKERYA
jgi:hypothetical protein